MGEDKKLIASVCFIAFLVALPMLYHWGAKEKHKFETQLGLSFTKMYWSGYDDGKKDGLKAGLHTCDDVLSNIDEQGRY